MTWHKQIVQVLSVILVICIVWNVLYLFWLPQVVNNEAFRSKGSYDHPTCKAKPPSNDPNAHSSQFTYRVGNDTLCTDPLMIKKAAQRLQNEPIRVGERVYALYNNLFRPATVIRVFKKGDDPTSLANSATTYSNNNPAIGAPQVNFLVRNNPLYYYQEDYQKGSQLSYVLSSQNLRQANASNVQKSQLSLAQTDDKVDVMFDDQMINQERVQSDQHDLRLDVSTHIRRRPQSTLVDECAKKCMNDYPNTWGVEVGGCHAHTCKCECVVPEGTTNKCRNIHRFSEADLQTNLSNHTHTDLHQLDSAKKEQYLLHKRLTHSESNTHAQQPTRAQCGASFVGGTVATDPTATGCDALCSQYQGEERELCLDKSKMTDFMNKLPTITSMGEGMCPKWRIRHERLSDCPPNHDVKCSTRVQADCKTHKASDYYKCQWHVNEPSNPLDKNSTGCYDKDQCMFSTDEASCEQNKQCMWNEDKHYCTKKAYCPSTCTISTETSCIKNPFCRWMGTECKINNVVDRQELRTILNGSPSINYQVLNQDIPPVDFSIQYSSQ